MHHRGVFPKIHAIICLFTIVIMPVSSTYGDDRKEFENSLGMKFVRIPEANVMFSIWLTRVKDYEIYVKEAGYKSETDVRSIGTNGWKNRGNTWDKIGFPQEPTHPVCGVSWDDSKAFCAWLTKKDRAAGLIKSDESYRLPTDSEWSHAVGIGGREQGKTPMEKRDGLTGVYPWGKEWPPQKGTGNFGGEEANDEKWYPKFGFMVGYKDEFPRTSPVGIFKPNQFGLYDMAGNAQQWCEDWYDASNSYHTMSGSSWKSISATGINSSYRSYVLTSDVAFDYIGFRIVLENTTSTK